MSEKGKIVVALSGGKDSTCAVLLCRERGFEVEAVTMRLGIAGEEERLKRVERLAGILEVPWRVLDLEQEFRRLVIGYFIDEYRRGRTPNPCIFCNRHFKFGILADLALAGDTETRLATGHYATLAREVGRVFLEEPRERKKSQIYFLAFTGPERMKRIVFPLADVTLEEVRSRVKDRPLGNKVESQDACFLSGIDLPDFLREHIPDAFVPGNIISPEGETIGRHEGVIHYTLGQRRGTRFASDRRLYVIRIDPQAHTITLGEDRHLWNERLIASDPVYWRELNVGEVLKVKIRSQHSGEPARIESAQPGRLEARFLKPVRALTPGQVAVFYDGDRVAAAGVIEPPAALI